MACRSAAVLAVSALACVPLSRAGTLFGLQFQGDGTDLYALPTVDPTFGKSLVEDALPLDYQTNAIAIGSTGMRRFRKVGTPALGRDGPAAGEGRETSRYYNLVPKMSDRPEDVTEAQSIGIDDQTGEVVVEEITMGPLLAFQFSESGDMFGLLPAATGGAGGGVQVKFFRDLEFGTGTPVTTRKWEERGQKSFDTRHAVFGLSSMDHSGGIFYCMLYDPAVGLGNGGQLVGLKMPDSAAPEPTDVVADLEVVTTVDVPLMLSSLAHDHATGKLFGVAWDKEVMEHRLVEIDPATGLGSSNPCDATTFTGAQSSCDVIECDYDAPVDGSSPTCTLKPNLDNIGLGEIARGDYDRLSPWLYSSALDHEEPLYYQMLHDSSVGTCRNVTNTQPVIRYL